MDAGALSRWDAGALSDWDTWALSRWDTGALSYWDTGALSYWDTGALSCTGRSSTSLRVSADHPGAAATVHAVRIRTAARTVAALAVATAAATSVGACSNSTSSDQSQSSGQQEQQGSQGESNGKHGPMFPECGGVTDEIVAAQTRINGLVKTAVNSVGCQWLAGGGILGPHFSFTWYRGSPIGRERKTEELTRASVDDVTIEGHKGWMAVGKDPTLGDSLCEIAIQFDDDFIEWSISFAEKGFPPACDVAKELTRQSIVNSK